MTGKYVSNFFSKNHLKRDPQHITVIHFCPNISQETFCAILKTSLLQFKAMKQILSYFDYWSPMSIYTLRQNRHMNFLAISSHFLFLQYFTTVLTCSLHHKFSATLKILYALGNIQLSLAFINPFLSSVTLSQGRMQRASYSHSTPCWVRFIKTCGCYLRCLIDI